MKYLVITLGTVTLIATLAAVILWELGYQVIGAVVGVTTFFLWLALLVTATATVVSWWSASLMQRGAELALRSQESDDRRDTVLIKSIADLTRTLLRHSQPELPALPLPSQQTDWLPALSEYDVVEGEVEREP